MVKIYARGYNVAIVVFGIPNPFAGGSDIIDISDNASGYGRNSQFGIAREIATVIPALPSWAEGIRISVNIDNYAEA